MGNLLTYSGIVTKNRCDGSKTFKRREFRGDCEPAQRTGSRELSER